MSLYDDIINEPKKKKKKQNDTITENTTSNRTLYDKIINGDNSPKVKSYRDAPVEEQKTSRNDFLYYLGKLNKFVGMANPVQAATNIGKNMGTDLVEKARSGEIINKNALQGGFSKGFDVADLILVPGATILDAGSNFMAGAENIAYSTAKVGAEGIAAIEDLKGNTEKAQRIRDRIGGKDEKTNEYINKQLLFRRAGDTFDDYSLSGNALDEVAQGAGYYGGMLGLQSLGVPWQVTAGLTSYGSALEEAYANDASATEANVYALISTAGEIGSEYMSGGIKLPGTGKTLDMFSGKLVDKFGSKTARAAMGFLVSTFGEGAEEVVSGWISSMGRGLTYGSDEEKSVLENIVNSSADYFKNDAGKDFIMGVAVTALTNGVNPQTYQTMKQGRNMVTGYTQNEQKVIDQVVNDTIANEEKNGKKLTNKEKKTIEEQVKSDLAKGYVDVSSIEKALGVKEKINQQLFDTENMLGRKLTQEEEQTEYDNAVKKYLEGLKDDSYLLNSYDEEGRKTQKFEVNLDDYKDEKQKAIVKKALDSGILNNTNRTHEFVDFVSKIAADKGVDFDFTNNQKIAESGFALEGKTINGFVNGKNISLNVDSNESLYKTVGHEISHILEGTDLYAKLQSSLKSYLGEAKWNKRLNELKELYGDVENANIENELTADLVGETLFTDTDFINNLSTKNRNLFEKIYNEIKYMYKVATAGSKEKRQLEKVKKIFDEAYRSNVKNVSEETRFELKENKEYGQYWQIETGKDIFKDAKTKNELKKKAFEYIKSGNNNFEVIDSLNNGNTVRFIRKSGQEYVYGSNSQKLTNKEYNQKMRIAPSIDDLINNATAKYKSPLTHDNKLFPNGFDNYQGVLKIDNNYFKYIVRLGINNDLNSIFYDISLENLDKEKGTDTIVPESKRPSLIKSKSVPLSDGIVSQNDKNVKYSISKQGKLQENGKDVTLETSDVGIHGNLMALHNLGEGKMNGILDLGGIPVPSIAITNPNIVDHNQFGDGTFIFDKETINPANRLNEVYDRDVWTPTFPTIEYDLNTKVIDKARKAVGGFGNSYLSNANSFLNNIEDKVNRQGLENVIEDLKNSNDFKYAYYKSLNPNFELLTKQDSQDLSTDYSNEMLKEFADEYGEIPHWANATSEQRQDIVNKFGDKLIPYLEERANKIIAEEQAKENPRMFIIGMAQSSVENIKEKMGALGWQDKLLENLEKIQKQGTTRTVNDYEATSNFINQQINQQEYEKWIDDLFNGLVAKKGIYNGKEYLTPQGNRRTFNQLHEDYNLQNLVKILTAQKTVAGEQGFGAGTGFGTIQAQMNNRFESIEDIKNAENRIVENAREITDQYRETIDEDMEQLGEYLKYRSEYSYLYDSAGTALNDFAGYKNLNMNNLNKALENNNIDSKKVPLELKQKIIDDITSLKDLQTDYFEAKPQRAVGLDEIQMAVIPNNWSEETKQRLQERGIPFTEYNPEVEGDRNRVINQFDNLKWSLSNDIAPYRQPGQIYGEDVRLQDELAPTIEDLDLPFDVTFDEIKNVLDLDKDVDRTEYLKVSDINKTTGQEYENQYSPLEKAKNELAQKKLERFIEKETYKAIDQATNVAARYGEFNKNQKKSLKNDFKRFANMSAEQLTNANTYNEFKDIIGQYADREMNFVDEHLKEVKSDVRKRKFNVSDIKDQITDYNDFRKAYFGRLNLTDTGQSIDSQYQELSELYPEYFSPDVVTEADMLDTLADFMDLDTTITEKYRLSEDEIDRIASKAFSTLVTEAPTEQQIQEFQDEIDRAVERKKSEVRRQMLLDEMGITIDDIATGKDINALGYQRTDPIRLNEKVFGYEIGNKINDATIRQTIHNTAEKMRWQNQERTEIKDLGIKARSKESAAVQKYGEGEYVNDLGEVVKYGDRELAAEFPNVETQNKIKKAAEVLRGKYDTYIDQINDVLTDLGYDAIPKRQNYFRHFMELNDKFSEWGLPFNRQSMNQDSLPTDINGLTDTFKPGKNYFASALQRKGIKTTYDAITGIDGYIESAGNLIFHTEDIQRYRALSKLIRETYGQQHGLDNIDIMTEAEKNQRVEDIYGNKLSKYAAWLDEQANALAGKKGGIDRAVERMFGRKVYSAANTLKSQVGSNMTGFNVRSAMTNFASVVQGMSKTNKIALLKGTISTLQNMIHNDGLENKSDFLTGRTIDNTQLSQKNWQKLANAGQVFMEATDHFTSNQIWRSKYFENLSKGMTEEQAIRNADDFAARVMGNRVQGSTAEIFNSKTLGFLTQFQLEVNNQWSNMVHDNKMDLQAGTKSAATVVFQLGQLAAFSYLFNGLMKALTGSDVMFDPIDLLKKIFNPDDDDKDKSLEERSREVLGDIVNQLPMASIFTGGRIPIQEAFKGATTGFKYLTGQTNEYGQKYTAADVFDDSLESLAYLLMPTGYGQLRKSYKGTVDMDYDVNLNPFKGDIGITKRPVRGSYTDSGNLRFTADNSIEGRIKNFLFGQYASDEAQSYVNSGYKTIDKSKLEELEDLDMTSSEYRKYRKGLSEAGTKREDKIEYIDSLDAPISQKNIMASNVLKRDVDMSEYDNYSSYEEFDYAYKNPEKYDFLKETGTSYKEYKNNQWTKDSIDWAYKDKTNYSMSKAMGSDIPTYRTYMYDIDNIKADKDSNGKSITGSRKQKVFDYVNSLELNEIQKAMLIRTQYSSFDDYNYEIVNYLNNQTDITLEEEYEILKKLGYKINNDTVSW